MAMLYVRELRSGKISQFTSVLSNPGNVILRFKNHEHLPLRSLQLRQNGSNYIEKLELIQSAHARVCFPIEL